jgi:hypothetical protein
MEHARQAALAGHSQVLEDGPDACDSESDSDHSDHGEEISYESAYTPEMIGPDKNPLFGPVKLTEA